MFRSTPHDATTLGRMRQRNAKLPLVKLVVLFSNNELVRRVPSICAHTAPRLKAASPADSEIRPHSLSTGPAYKLLPSSHFGLGEEGGDRVPPDLVDSMTCGDISNPERISWQLDGKGSTCAEYSRGLGAKRIVVPGRLVPLSLLAINLLEEGGI